MKTYILEPQLPLRAFAIAAGLSLVGGSLIALGHSGGWHWALLVMAWLLLAGGVALAIAAVWSLRSMRTFIDLTEEGYAIRGPGGLKSGTWDQVTKVTQTLDGRHLTLYHGEVGRTHILRPARSDDHQLAELLADMSQRLDSNRGYGWSSDDSGR